MQAQRASACPRCGRVFIEGERVCPFDAGPLREQARDAADPLIGAVVDGSYVILSKLGEGGMGVVYRALQQRLDRQVALKVLGPRFGGDLKASERFRSEARAVSQLTCPHTVTVHDFGSTEDGTLYLAMQLLQGESLRARMQRQPLTAREAVSVAADICDSLAEAHERTPQIIHRDIKPDNIFVRATDAGGLFATVLDFGLARIQDSQKLTATNSVIGTVAYMAPEQAQGRKDVDGRLDLYALGVMLFEMLAGRLPFDSPDKLGVMYKHVYDAPPKLRGLMAGRPLPSSLESLVESLLAKSPAQRPPSARAVRGRLLEIAQELGFAAAAPRRPPSLRPERVAASTAARSAAAPAANPPRAPRPLPAPAPLDDEISEDDEPTVIRRPPDSPAPRATAGPRAGEAHPTDPDTDPDPAPTAGDRSTAAILASAGLAPKDARRAQTAWMIGAALLLASVLGAGLLWRGAEPPPARSAAPAAAPIRATPAAATPAPEPPPPAPPSTAPAPLGSAAGTKPGAAPPAAEKAEVKRSKKPASPKATPDLDDEMREYLHGGDHR